MRPTVPRQHPRNARSVRRRGNLPSDQPTHGASHGGAGSIPDQEAHEDPEPACARSALRATGARRRRAPGSGGSTSGRRSVVHCRRLSASAAMDFAGQMKLAAQPSSAAPLARALAQAHASEARMRRYRDRRRTSPPWGHAGNRTGADGPRCDVAARGVLTTIDAVSHGRRQASRDDGARGGYAGPSATRWHRALRMLTGSAGPGSPSIAEFLP